MVLLLRLLAWLAVVALDIVALALGKKIPYERRARHVAEAKSWGAVFGSAAGALALTVLGLGVAARLDEPASTVAFAGVFLVFLATFVAMLAASIRWNPR